MSPYPYQTRRNTRQRGGFAQETSTPAPFGGWNTRDGLDTMEPIDAVLSDNFFPKTRNVSLRNGYARFATGINGGAAVETIFEWAGQTAQKQLVAAGGKIFDTTAGGSMVGATPLGTGYGSDRWEYVMFPNVGGNWIRAVNGVDTPIAYNGTAITTTPAITPPGGGSPVTDYAHVNVFKTRLFFCIKNSLKFAYLPVSSIGGTAIEFDLAPLCKRGGTLVAMGTWTRDSGDGPDDLAAFITSEGEIILYQGSNPSDANDWSMIGKFRTGKPIGKRCFFSVGPDLIIITQNGYIPLSKIMALGEANIGGGALSDKIGSAVSEQLALSGSLFGWQPILYPRADQALINVPVRLDQNGHVLEAVQHVVNTITGAWCRFRGMNAGCWGMLNGRLYFGSSGGVVYLADEGSSDDGAVRTGKLKTSFQYIGGRGPRKQFNMVQPVFSVDADFAPAIGVNVDFNDLEPTSMPNIGGTAPARWDAGLWDVGIWGGAPFIRQSWIGVTGEGNCAALYVVVSSSTAQIALNSINWQFLPGGAQP